MWCVKRCGAGCEGLQLACLAGGHVVRSNDVVVGVRTSTSLFGVGVPVVRQTMWWSE
ncbi:hypothetical protein [Paenibacillus plantarum]|uniref:hypothetical protein n=1 Tax=Paenibacillus plantarum TaxID=2654975 RepID=UPI001492BCD6|nr:hypothetical protein [Paenibacillus plantarum]